ncbi:MAG: hypothetical protein N4A47_04600 [Clostridia bacterium]|jgi:ribonuclease HI|nr:hypothetical protein [Clostridia bacterium]
MNIYVDGGFNKKLNIGGYGIIRVEERDKYYYIEEHFGYEEERDNNYMEMLAYSKARELYGKDIIIYTDSRDVIYKANDKNLKWIKGHKNKWNILADRAANNAIVNKVSGSEKYKLNNSFYILKDRVCDIDISKYEYIKNLSYETKEFFKYMICEHNINVYEQFNHMRISGINKEGIYEKYINKNYRKKYIKGNEESIKEIIERVWR